MTLKELAIDHEYYCSDHNYYSNDCYFSSANWQEFIDEMGGADLDMNLLFRWDITPYDEEIEDKKGFYMQLFYMQQRKGRFIICNIESVTDEDVPNIIKFLTPRFLHLKKLWLPLV